MSNPTFSTGDLTREVSAAVNKFRLVSETDGLIAHAGADAFPFGVVTEDAAPDGASETNALLLGLPSKVRVGTSQRVVKIATTGAAIAAGAPVYAAADGFVAGTGTVQVGLADQATSGDLTRVHLFHPATFAG